MESTCPTLRTLLPALRVERLSEVVYAEGVDWSGKDLRKRDAAGIAELLQSSSSLLHVKPPPRGSLVA